MAKPVYVKLAVFVPSSHADKIRKALVEAGCGKMGRYDSCFFSVRGVGQFRALPGAKPFLGKEGKVEKVAEERIETLCSKNLVNKAVAALKAVHPYEHPPIDIIPLL